MISFEQIEFWNWWVIAVFLIGLEVFAPGAVFLWMGIAAGIVGFVLLAFPETSWQFQLLIFAAISVVSILVRSEEHTSELQSLMRISYAVFCLQNKNINT